MQNKILTYIGFAQRAKKIVSGDSAAEAILNQGRARLIIMAEDAAPRTLRNFQQRAGDLGIPCITYGSKIELGTAIGKSPRSVLVVIDRQFADTIVKSFAQEDRGN